MIIGLFLGFATSEGLYRLYLNAGGPEIEDSFEQERLAGDPPFMPGRMSQNAKLTFGKHVDGRFVHGSTATHDEFGRRRTPLPLGAHPKRHVLLFGCSFAYGAGVSDNETILAHLATRRSDLAPYNYGIPGGSLDNIYESIENTPLQNEVKEPEGIGLFFLFSQEHLMRLKDTWAYDRYRPSRPLYETSASASPKRLGHFRDLHPVKSFFFEVAGFSRLLQSATHLFYREGDFSTADYEHGARLLAGIAGKYRKDFPAGRFFVVEEFGPHPFYEFLKKEGLEVLILQGTKGDQESVKIPFDGHRTSEGNKLIADAILQALPAGILKP